MSLGPEPALDGLGHRLAIDLVRLEVSLSEWLRHELPFAAVAAQRDPRLLVHGHRRAAARTRHRPAELAFTELSGDRLGNQPVVHVTRTSSCGDAVALPHAMQ